jgi:hypothetical protein
MKRVILETDLINGILKSEKEQLLREVASLRALNS